MALRKINIGSLPEIKNPINRRYGHEVQKSVELGSRYKSPYESRSISVERKRMQQIIHLSSPRNIRKGMDEEPNSSPPPFSVRQLIRDIKKKDR